ncbi:MAG: 50S ribosomal protein L22 [bacterium]|nr:50S ribosomal protein L22 [bacterium]
MPKDKVTASEVKKEVVEVKAFARYIHVSPQKLRLVSNLVKKVPVDQALEQLKFSSRSAALPLTKAINSAIANAVHNHDFKKEDMFVKSITIDPGPMFKTFTPRAQGRAFMIRKRTSHINVVLEEKKRTVKSKRMIFQRSKSAIKQTKEDKTKVKEQVSKAEDIEKIQKPWIQPKPKEKMKKSLVDLKRRLFNRKSGT